MPITIDTIFRAVEIALSDGPVSVDQVGALVKQDPTELLADLMREAGRRGYYLRCGMPNGTILALAPRA